MTVQKKGDCGKQPLVGKPGDPKPAVVVAVIGQYLGKVLAGAGRQAEAANRCLMRN